MNYVRILQNILLVIALFCIGFTVYTLFSGNNGGNGDGSAAIAKQLDTVIADQRSLTTQLQRSTETVNKLVEGNKRIEESIGRIEGFSSSALEAVKRNDPLIAESRRIAEENQRIIRGILEGNKTENK